MTTEQNFIVGIAVTLPPPLCAGIALTAANNSDIRVRYCSIDSITGRLIKSGMCVFPLDELPGALVLPEDTVDAMPK